MPDIIQLLPDAIANQIAAGEVIQRPASVVKELLENAIDAGSTQIKLYVKDGGKTLVQVTDNGFGMSETDARLCFERHATSKIKKAADLFAINTLGFRGEAMASIAAIAHVDLKTRTNDQEVGTEIEIQGSKIVAQNPCQCPKGTTLAIKNLFFNVPARRKFLKSIPVEMRHIVEEFQRVALANPNIHFILNHNNTELFHLPATNLRKRIVGIFGHNFNERLIPIKEETDFLRIYGFIGKPKYARKTRGEQYFFVNERFIKSSYLNHALITAYDELLQSKTYPLYCIFIDIDPARIDINIHPTKQEIKFDDEKVIYTFINAAVKKALGVYSITPTLDFEADISPQFMNFSPRSNRKTSPASQPKFTGKPTDTPQNKSEKGYQKTKVPQNWEELYKINAKKSPEVTPEEITTITIKSNFKAPKELALQQEEDLSEPIQLHQTYIMMPIKTGFILVDQQAAHERILYEKYLNVIEQSQTSTQKILFPKKFSLPTADAAILSSILPDIKALGYDIEVFGKDTFVIHGFPSDVKIEGNSAQIIEGLIEQFKLNLDKLKLDKRTNLAMSIAKSRAIKKGNSLSVAEMKSLLDELFACETPYSGLNGRATFIKQQLTDIEKQFDKKKL